MRGGRRKSFLCPATLLPLLMLAISINLMCSEVEAAKSNEFADIEDNDFAEFDFDDETDESVKVTIEDDEDEFEQAVVEEEDAVVEDEADGEDDEFSHFNDDEEFEGFNKNDDHEDPDEFYNEPKAKKQEKVTPSPAKQPIKIVNIPAHLRTNWENFYVEIIMIIGIVVYFLNFFTGKAKNQKMANQLFNAHRNTLESQFSLVGDDGTKNIEEIQEPLIKESENIFRFWCSGRICCEGMLVELKLLKRQDLVGVISNIMKPSHDQIHIRVDMSPEDMDSFIFCIANKKSSLRLSKEMNDLATYCPERRPADKFDVPGNYLIMSEVAEVASAMLDAKLISMFKKFPDAIDTIHFSDQFTGPKPADDQQPLELPQGKKVLIFVFNILHGKNKSLEEAIEDTKPLVQLVFYCLDKVKRYKLSREAKAKADKNRSRVAENHWKSIHAIKAEKAAEEREKRRRDIKERIKEIEDPEKQRKMEEREARRDKKKAQPKIKQLKIKAM